MAEIDKEKLRRAIVNRGMVVPVVEYDDGSQGWGVPGLIMEPIEAWQRLQAGASDNVARMQQGLPFDPQAAGDAFAVTGAAAMGSVAAPKPSGAYVTSGGAKGELNGNFASKMVGYDPRPLPQRPFYDDYAGTPRSDASGRLQESIEGVELNAPFVAGRTMAGGGDAGIGPQEWESLSQALVGKAPRAASSAELGRDVGAFDRRVPAGADAPAYEILYSRSLEPGQTPRVVGHEIGHAIDEFAGQIPTDGLLSELKQVYHDLATGQHGRTRHRTEPQHLGYAKSEVPREMMAEAIRAYMTDPNYLKSVAPKTAGRIREYANENPRVAKAIQFNANPKESAALSAAVQGEKQGIRAYHGSPYDFDRFDISKMGTGEGAQAYGPGLYFAENQEVARAYEGMLAGNGYDPAVIARDALIASGGDPRKALDILARDAPPKTGLPEFDILTDNYGVASQIMRDHAGGKPMPLPERGRLYEVNINADPNDFLDWDAPIYGQQKAFDALYPDGYVGARENVTEANAGSMLAREGQLNEKAAQALREAGIPGIKYLDQGSRGAGQGSRNYVVFDDSLIEIVKKYGIAGAASLYGVSELELMEAMQEQGL